MSVTYFIITANLTVDGNRIFNMKILIKNTNLSICLPLTALRCAGFWPPENLTFSRRVLYNCYGALSFMFLLGIYLMIQVVDLYLIWGDIPLMTGAAFLLFTNLAQVAKIATIWFRKDKIQNIISECDSVLKEVDSKLGKEIVNSCNRETSYLLLLYFILTSATGLGWATSAEKKKLPLQAWYPYDTSKSPAYEMTFSHQVLALFLAAYLNVGKDTLVVTLIAQCRCRLRLLGLMLRSMCKDLHEDVSASSRVPSPHYMLTPKQETIVNKRLKDCVKEHQRVLESVERLQDCFSEPTFIQFTVSLIIICVTAFQLISQTSNMVRFFSMFTYLVNMAFQVFLYCYQGNQLTEESADLADAAYDLPWYTCSVQTRRKFLILMTRCRRVAKITAGSFTTLSLASFMAIIKASYSLFTLLQQVDEEKI